MRFHVVIISAALLLAPLSAHAQGLDTLREAARQNRRDAAAQAAWGRAALRAGEYREARRALMAAARLSRRDARALLEVAKVSFAEGNYRAAQRDCRAVERAAAGSVTAHVCHARAFLVWNRSARAFEEIEAALAAAPNDFDALLALGDAHRLRASVSDAEGAYQRAMRADPTSALPHLGLGRLYAAADRRADALRALRAAQAKDGDDPEIAYELGMVLRRGDEAIAQLRRAVNGRARWVEARVALGEALIAAGQWDEARVELERAVELSNRAADAYTALGRVLTQAGEHEAAERALTRAAELVPNSYPTALALAALYAATERNEEAFEKYREAAGYDPRHPAAMLDAARLALRLDRDVLAAGFLDRLLQVHETHGPGLALYGDIMMARRDAARARGYYQRALAAGGDFDRARVQTALRQLGAPPTRRRHRHGTSMRRRTSMRR